jgi:hypothetical protein
MRMNLNEHECTEPPLCALRGLFPLACAADAASPAVRQHPGGAGVSPRQHPATGKPRIIAARNRYQPQTLAVDDAEPLRNLLERHALGLDHHRAYPDQLQNHHPGEEREHVTWREGAYHLRKQRG